MKRIFFLGILVSSLGLMTYVRADDFSAYLDGISATMLQGNGAVLSREGDVKGMIQNFCNAVTSAGSMSSNKFTYDAKQSAFVYLLCSNINGDRRSTAPGFEKKGGIFKLTTFAQLGIEDVRPVVVNTTSKTNFCSPNTDMSQCNLSKYIPKLFNIIINDYANLKEPTLFGFDATQDFDAGANAFSQNYFTINICDQDNPKYPNTCRTLKNYIKNTQKILSDVKVFLPKNIQKDPKACEEKNYSLFLCGLYGDTTNSLQRFLNLTYNELFYYRLFMSYYTLMIKANPTVLLKAPVAIANTEVYQRTSTFSNEFTRSQQALSMTLRMMRDIYSAFPLHIGFLMYQEDLQGFLKPLAKIYTPISQLYYTLQNVQVQK